MSALLGGVLISLKYLNYSGQYQELCISISSGDPILKHKGKSTVSEEREITEKCLQFFFHPITLIFDIMVQYDLAEKKHWEILLLSLLEFTQQS